MLPSQTVRVVHAKHCRHTPYWFGPAAYATNNVCCGAAAPRPLPVHGRLRCCSCNACNEPLLLLVQCWPRLTRPITSSVTRSAAWSTCSHNQQQRNSTQCQ
jgi:hypothetical protein